VLWCCWMGDGKGVQSINNLCHRCQRFCSHATDHQEVLFQNSWRQRTVGNWLTCRKWLLKCSWWKSSTDWSDVFYATRHWMWSGKNPAGVMFVFLVAVLVPLTTVDICLLEKPQTARMVKIRHICEWHIPTWCVSWYSQFSSFVHNVNLRGSAASSSVVGTAMRLHTERVCRRVTHSCTTTGTDHLLTDQRMTTLTTQLHVLVNIVAILIATNYFVKLLPDSSSLMYFNHVDVGATS